MQPKVDYLGYCIDKDGLHTMPDKVMAITEAPRPGSVRELRAFLGLVHYYGRFINNLSNVAQPLNKLLCKGVLWRWSEACDRAFKTGFAHLGCCKVAEVAIFLLGYQYVLEFRSTGKHCNADGFSRLPRVTAEGRSDNLAAEATSFNVHQIDTLPLTTKQLAAATLADSELGRVMRYCHDGWPAEVPKELHPYFQKREQMSIEGDCLFRGMQVVIPTKLQPQVLAELHTSHPGIVRMKGLARSRVWWPGMAGQIEEKVQSCTACQSHRNRPAPVPLNPWERIHVDFAGPMEGVMYLVVVDSYSKWVEVEPMRTTTTEKTLDVLRMLFARYGLPKELVTDNGPQFTSTVFTRCLQENGICHLRSAPYHSATNGAAERVVQTFKNFLRAGKDDSGSHSQKLAQFLLVNRTTPHSTTGVPPAELFLKRSLRTRLDIMRPSVDDKVAAEQEKQKRYHDSRAQDRKIDAGQEVMVRNFREGPKWVKGVVLRKVGAVMFEVRVGDGIWR